jgi:hypothetical protein
MRASHSAAAAAVVVLVAVFVILAVGVVHGLRPVNGRVSTSFDRVIAQLDRGIGGTSSVTPRGCEKRSLYFFRCTADVQRGRATGTVLWRLWLHDDGCWETVEPLPSPTVLGPLRWRFQRLEGCDA